MSIALGALRNRIQLPDGSADPVDEPARQADEHRRDRARVHVERPRLRADAQRLARSTTSPTRPTCSGGHRVGVQKQSWNSSLYLARAAARLLRAASGTDPSRRHHRLEGADRHRRPVRRQPRRRRRWSTSSRPTTPPTTSTTRIAPAPALLANGWNDDLFPVDESLRYYNKVRAKHPNAPISMFHLDFGHSPRAGADLRRRPRGADARPRTPGWTTTSRASGPSPPTRAAASTSSPPSARSAAPARATTRRRWAQLAPGEVRLDGAGGADDRRARHRAEQRVHVRRRLHDDLERRQRRRRRRTRSRRRRSAYTLAGSPTIVAKLTVNGANDMVAARLYDVDGATAAPDRPRRPAPARRRRRPDAAGLPAAPAGLDGPARPRAQARAAGAGLAVPAHARRPRRSSRSPVSDLQLRLPVVDAPGTDLGNGVSVAAPAAKVVPAGYKLAREYATDADGGAGGTVPATLSLTLGGAATFGAFTPGVGASTRRRRPRT